MLRKEKEITDQAAIESIINNAAVCRIALSDDNNPYIIPVCFGYKSRTLYFHCAHSGKKLAVIRQNPKVCFEMDEDVELKKAELPCNWGLKYKSVIGFGKAVIIDATKEKESALSIIMKHYSNEEHSFPGAMVDKTTVVKIFIETITGKQSGCPQKDLS